MKRLSSGLALPAVAVALMVPGGSLGAPASTPPCEPDGSTTLAETPAARAYKVERERGGRSTSYTYGCLKAFGSQVLLASDAEPAALFPAPAISLIGPYVGYAVDTDTDTQSPGGRMTYVEVDDLRPQEPGQESAGLVVSAGPREVARVGSLKVSRRGAVAWIACPAPTTGALAADPSGRCTRPGAYDRVYRALLGSNGVARVKLLDKGRAIDPRSLRRVHSGVAWRHAGKTWVTKLR